jgi:hypothetical protein
MGAVLKKTLQYCPSKSGALTAWHSSNSPSAWKLNEPNNPGGNCPDDSFTIKIQHQITVVDFSNNCLLLTLQGP